MARRRPSSNRRRRRRRPGPDGTPERDLTGARAVARRRLGVSKLHVEQEAALEAVLAGRDVLALLPTGYGKSVA